MKGDGETGLAKKMWRKVMEEVHKLDGFNEARDFTKPDGIVNQTVCSQSGRLPIPGYCDGTHTSEIFASDSVPTQNCNVHIGGSGMMCAFEHVSASPECPFQIPGNANFPIPPQLEKGFKLSGYANGANVDEEGNPIEGAASGVHCSHTWEWRQSADPNEVNQLMQNFYSQFAEQLGQLGGQWGDHGDEDHGDGQGWPFGFGQPDQGDNQDHGDQGGDNGDHGGDNGDHGDEDHGDD